VILDFAQHKLRAIISKSYICILCNWIGVNGIKQFIYSAVVTTHTSIHFTTATWDIIAMWLANNTFHMIVISIKSNIYIYDECVISHRHSNMLISLFKNKIKKWKIWFQQMRTITNHIAEVEPYTITSDSNRRLCIRIWLEMKVVSVMSQ